MHIYSVRKPWTHSMTNSVSIHSQSLWNKFNYPTWLKQKLLAPPENAVLKLTEGQCNSHFQK